MKNSQFDISEHFNPLYYSKKRFFFVSGGRGSLKSHSLHDFTVRLTYQKGEGILFTRYTMKAAEKSIIPEFKKALERLGVENDFEITRTHIINKHTRSFIWFTGIKTNSSGQTGNLKSLSGVTNWIVEEAEDFKDEDEFNRINKSIRSKHTQNRVILVMNPTTKEHFIYKKWFDEYKDYIKVDGFDILVTNHPRVEHIHTTYLIATQYLDRDWLIEASEARTRAKRGINPLNGKKLTEKQFKEAKKSYVNEYLGGWKEKADGVIFENWTRGKFDESLPYVFGADYGFAKDPSTLVRVAVDNKKKHIYVKECLYEKHLSTANLIQLYKQIVKDDIVICDSAELRVINDLIAENINAQPTMKKPGSVVAGLNKMLGYQIIVDGDSTNLINELNNYHWIDKESVNGKSSIPIDDHNHLIDALRYAFMYLSI